jgi:excisionase family DNA binding protein
MKDVVLEPDIQMSDTQFLTRSEVAKLLGVSPNTVTRWAREGRLACLVTLGGHHRFDREVVEQIRKQQYRAKQDRDDDRTG